MNSKTNLSILKAGKSKRKGRARSYSITRKHEIYYTKELLAISKQCKAEGNEILAILKDEGQFVGDSAIGDAPAFLDRIKLFALGGVSRSIRRISGAIATKVVFGQAESTERKLSKQLKDMTGVNAAALIKKNKLDDVLDMSIAANVSLIESIPTQYHAKLESIILKSLQNGKGESWVAAQVKRLGKTTDARAKLIARDQIGSVNSAVNAARHKELGIEEYYWRTCKDEKVRHKHKLREGQKIRWDDPPDDGHAGEPINCRCDAEPVIDD